jgi:hypothetical protein
VSASVLVLVLSLFIFGEAWASPLTLKEKREDLIQYATFIKENYAPIEQKRTLYGADVDQLLPKYLSLVSQSRTDEDYYYLIERFSAEFHDGHLLIIPIVESSRMA